MDIIKIVLTLVLIAALIYALKKNMNAAIALTALGLIGIFVGSIINNITPLPAKQSSGILFIDVFKWFSDTGVFNSISTAGVIIAVFAYVFYMDHIKASTLFALKAAKPISKIKNKNLLIIAVFILTDVLRLVIPSSSGRIALLIGALFPILIVCGVSKATSAVCIFVASMHSWGPTNTMLTVFNSYAGTKFDLTQYFLDVQWPWAIASTLLISILFIITSKYFDKRENAISDQTEYKGIDPKSLGIPQWYAILPIVPLVIVIVFSGIVKALPVLNIPQVLFMCFMLVFAVLFLVTKDKNKVAEDAFSMYQGTGVAVANVVSLIIAGVVFGKGIEMLQGINVILKPFLSAGANVNITMFILITGIIGLFIGAAGCSAFIPMAILGPVYVQVFAAAGANPDAMVLVGVVAWTMCMGLAPATALIALASTGSGVPITSIWKRSVIPMSAWALFYIIAACIIA